MEPVVFSLLEFFPLDSASDFRFGVEDHFLSEPVEMSQIFCIFLPFFVWSVFRDRSPFYFFNNV